MSEFKTTENKSGEDVLKNLLNSTLKDIMSAVNAECGSLFLFDPRQNELILDSFYNSGNLSLLGLRKKIGEGISGKVVDIRQPILVKDINKDVRFRRNGFSHYRTDSFISIPLFTSRGLLGLINLADKSNGEPFSEKDLEFAVTVARYVCLSIDHLYNFDKQKSVLEKYASVGKLAAGIVHEVNNPLDGIIRYTNILLEQTEDKNIIHEYLLEVKKGLNRIANITKSLLEFSHQVNSTSVQTQNYVDIHQLIDESLEVLTGRLNGQIQVDKKYKNDLPKVLDFGLSSVVINIIKNALDAMPQSGRLEISTEIKENWLVIAFKDTGTGMDTKVKGHIFEPFFTTKSIDKGSGLGLAISKEIINKYGGDIEVESVSREGSTFRVFIPQKYLKNAA